MTRRMAIEEAGRRLQATIRASALFDTGHLFGSVRKKPVRPKK